MAIPQRGPRGHKCLRSSAYINSYGFLRAMRPTPQQPPHRRVPTPSHSTTDNRPNRSTYPEAKPVHIADRAHCSDVRTTVRQPPDAGTPRSTGPRAAPPQPPATHRAHHAHIPSNTSPNDAARTLRTPLRSHEDLNASKLNPTGPNRALTIYTYPTFLCTERVTGQPGLARPPAPRNRDPTNCTRRQRSADSPHNVPSTSPLGQPAEATNVTN